MEEKDSRYWARKCGEAHDEVAGLKIAVEIRDARIADMRKREESRERKLHVARQQLKRLRAVALAAQALVDIGEDGNHYAVQDALDALEPGDIK